MARTTAFLRSLIVRAAFPRPEIASTLAIAATPKAITATMPTPGGALVLPAQTPLAVVATMPGPFIAPAVLPLAVTVSKPTALIGGQYLAQVIGESSLVGWWRFNETAGTTAVDTKASNNGTYTSSPTLNQAGPLAFLSDSLGIKLVSSSYVSIPHTAAVDVADVFTVEFFIKRTNISSARTLVTKQTGTFSIEIDSTDHLSLGKSFVAVLWTATTTFTDTIDWHHVAVTKNGATTHIYLDGVDLTLAGSNATMVTASTAIQVGRQGDGSGHATDDYIAELAIYNTALSGGSVTNHYNAAVADGLV